MTATASRGRTARKVLGSLGVVGAAAAVAGMGTFGTFTDSTAPLNATVSSGTLHLQLTGQNATAAVPMTASAFVPGDSLSRPVDLTNTGSLDMSSITLQSVATTSSLLNTDTVNGLQLSITSCPVDWTQGTPGRWTCSSTPTTVLASGRAVIQGALSNAASATAGQTDHLLLTLTLPTSADNTFQGKTSTLALTFTGTQKTGTTR